MKYLVVEWIHTLPDEPICLYYELDPDWYERRKVEEYRNGTLHTADATHKQGTTFLAWEPHSLLAEIEADPQFRVSEITALEFERVWDKARRGNLQSAMCSTK